MNTDDFESFEKIPRLNRQVVVTEKIDGSNVQVYITDDGLLYAGSRNRWIEPGKQTDHFGFAAWVQENAEELMQLGPGRHFGEWYGQGIARKYGLDRKKFALFNVGRWRGESLVVRDDYDELVLPPAVCDVVPVLDIINGFDTEAIERSLDRLRQFGSVAEPGFMRPEGVVLFHTQSRRLFKVTLENDEKPKGAPAWA